MTLRRTPVLALTLALGCGGNANTTKLTSQVTELTSRLELTETQLVEALRRIEELEVDLAAAQDRIEEVQQHSVEDLPEAMSVTIEDE